MVVWNLKDIYPSFEKDFVREAGEVKRLAEEIVHARPLLQESISEKDFLSMFDKYKRMHDILSRLHGYADLELSENTSSTEGNARTTRVDELATDAANKTLFFSLWWKDVSDKNAKRLMSCAGDAAYYLEASRRFKKHVLSEREEQIINVKSMSGSNTITKLYDIITNGFTFEIKIGNKKKTLTQEQLTVLVRDKNPKVRALAYTTLLTKFKENRVVLGELYKSVAIDWKSEGVQLRKYDNPIAWRNLGNDISDESVSALLRVCRKNVPLFKRYLKVKARVCGIKKPSRFDLYAPLAESKKKYSFDEAKKIVLDTFDSFSPEMGRLAREVIENKHIHSDIVPNKRSGAFCSSIDPSIHPYVLLSFNGTINDVSTLAHELGHAVHSLLARDKSSLVWHAPLPLAETASIFAEMLLESRLLKTANARERKIILLRQLDHLYASINRQAFFVIFEELAHENISELNLDQLEEKYFSLLHEQFDGALDVPDLFRHEWLYIPHIFHTPFYCYAYAFGNLLVLALYNMYLREGERAVSKIIKILSYGGSKMPADILREVGIDISSEKFWQEGFDVIEKMIEQVERDTA